MNQMLSFERHDLKEKKKVNPLAAVLQHRPASTAQALQIIT